MRKHSQSFRARRGFTLIELLVVIAIIVVISAFLLPAFTRIIESSNFSAAVNSVSAALGNARARAISTGRPTGVGFLFDIETERYTLVILEAASMQGGVLTDCAPGLGADHYAQGLRPATNSVLVELPRQTGVFALPAHAISGRDPYGRIAMDNLIDDCHGGAKTWQWYAGEVLNGEDADASNDVPLWIFPRNDARLYTAAEDEELVGADPWDRLADTDAPPTVISDRDAIEAVRNASSFVVLFSADGTVQDVDRSGGRDYTNFYIELADEPYDRSSVTRDPYDDPNRFDPENFGRSPIPRDRRRPNPEVMLRAASQLAVVDLKRLSDGVGFPRAWLVRSAESRLPAPTWLTDEDENRAVNYVDNDRAREVSRWIDRNAEIIGFNRYTGNVIRRTTQ
mgnify:CR=1 FL=1